MKTAATSLSTARMPQRLRGKERFAHLLDVTEQLLAEHTDTEVTLASIAEQAGVPLPSVYHFFPNRNAIFVELAKRFHKELQELAGTPISPPPESWQSLLLTRQSRGREYLNAHPAALRLFMGAGVSAEVRTLDLRGNSSLARARAEEFRTRFVCTGLDTLEHWLAVSVGVMDGVWTISYAEHGCITDAYLQEAWRASVAYLRSYLPEDLAVRPEATL